MQDEDDEDGRREEDPGPAEDGEALSEDSEGDSSDGDAAEDACTDDPDSAADAFALDFAWLT